jgi:hypothetical protein
MPKTVSLKKRNKQVNKRHKKEKEEKRRLTCYFESQIKAKKKESYA